MTTEQRKQTMVEFELVKAMLDERGIPYEEHNPFISFNNGDGECWVFPSQTYDEKLAVHFSRKTRCDTAEQALRACGIMGEQE